MKKTVFTLLALLTFALASEAYTYGWSAPRNTYGGNNAVIKTTPTANGSPQAYQDMVNASYYRNMNQVNINHRYYDEPSNTSPRKTRRHGSAANKHKH